VLGVLVAVVAVALDRAGLPAPALFAGLVVGLLAALLTKRTARLPPSSQTAALGVIGVAVGVTVQPATLAGLAGHWLPVTVITVGTLALSMAAGPLLARWTELDAVTAALGMISGGAAGITALSDELGADARIVAVLQYLRVLLVVVLMPVAVVVLFGGAGGTDRPSPPASDVPLALAAVAVLSAVGTWLGRRAGLPSPAMLGPLLLTAPLAALDAPGTDAVPPLLEAVAFALVGADVGLRFTADTVRTVRRILPVVLALILAVVAGNAALGLLLSAVTGITPLDGYLATTPGGLYVVLAVAAASRADTTVVLAVQVLRLVVMLVAAPPLTRLLLRGR
jgi:membrane AbrB-like protein